MKTMMKKPAVKKPAMKKFAMGGAVDKKKPIKKYAEGGTVQMQNMAGMTPEQMKAIKLQQQQDMMAQQQQKQAASFGPAPSMTPAQAQANMMPAGTRAGPSAPQADAAMIQAAQQMASDKAAAKKQSQQPIPAAQRVAAFRRTGATRGRPAGNTMLGMAKGGVVAKKAVAMKGKKK